MPLTEGRNVTTTKTPFETRAFGDLDFGLGTQPGERVGAAFAGLDPDTRRVLATLGETQTGNTPPPPADPAIHGHSSTSQGEAHLPLTPPPGQEGAPEYTDRSGNGMNMAEEKLNREQYYNEIIRNAEITETKTYPSTGLKVEYFAVKKLIPSVKGHWVEALEELYVLHVPGEGKRTLCTFNDAGHPKFIDEHGNFSITNAKNNTTLLQRNGLHDASQFLPERAYPVSAHTNGGKGRVSCDIFPDGKVSLCFSKGEMKDNAFFLKTREGAILTVNAEHRLVLADSDKLPPDLPQQDRNQHAAFVASLERGEKSMDDILASPADVKQDKLQRREERGKVDEFLASKPKPTFVERLSSGPNALSNHR